MRMKLYLIAPLLALITLAACHKENNYSNESDVLRDLRINLNTANSNHSTEGMSNHSVLQFRLSADGTLFYDTNIDSLQDQITAATINLGDPITDGPVILDLNPRITNGYINGAVFNIRQSLLDTLLDSSIQKYFNVVTKKVPQGLLRGQINGNLIFSKTVQLVGDSIVPAVATATKGVAYIRLGSDKTLYSKVEVTNDDPADPVTTASINTGAAGANGPALINVANSAADFGVPKTFTLTDAQYSTFRSGKLYVKFGSVNYPIGKVRAQLK